MPDLRIDDLVLRVPGLTGREARRLAGLIVDRLRERSASGVAPSALARLEIKLDLPPGLPLEEVANRIVNRLAGQLGLEEA